MEENRRLVSVETPVLTQRLAKMVTAEKVSGGRKEFDVSRLSLYQANFHKLSYLSFFPPLFSRLLMFCSVLFWKLKPQNTSGLNRIHVNL